MSGALLTIAMSGSYDIYNYLESYFDDNVYYNNPAMYMKNLDDDYHLPRLRQSDFVVIASGAFVRLTGSGLGCENWPSCGDRPYPEQGFHAFVEFGNRLIALVGIVMTLVTLVASRRAVGLSGWGR